MTSVLALMLFVQAPVLPPEIISGPGSVISRPLATHLELTEDQLAKITEIKSQSNTYQAHQNQKQVMLHLEIAQEIRKQSPDPFVVGTHYVELESIRRKIDSEKNKVTGRIQELLSDVQKAKLVQLSQALSQQSLACDALNSNFISAPAILIRDPFPGNVIPPSRIDGELPPSVLGIGIGSSNLCGSTYPSGIIGSITSIPVNRIDPIETHSNLPK